VAPKGIDGTFVLTSDVFAPTVQELAAIQAEIDGDDALTKAIESVKDIVRSSGRFRVDTKKVQLNRQLVGNSFNLRITGGSVCPTVHNYGLCIDY
jgi:hypothetical protein